MNYDEIRETLEKNHIQDFEGRTSFYPFFEQFQWVGEIHYLQRNLCIITHLCDLNGIEYARTKKGVLVCAAGKGSRFQLFDEFAKVVPHVYHQERQRIHSPEFYINS